MSGGRDRAGLRLDETVSAASRRLAARGVQTPQLDARLLAQAAFGLSHEEIVGEPARLLTSGDVGRFHLMVERRGRGEPVAYILGEKEFWGRRFFVTPDVLIPRPDSETLVAAALERLEGVRAPRILDLGVGSGCLLLTLLAERPDAWGLGVDISEPAVRVAGRNAHALGLASRADLIVGNWTSALRGEFDAVVANPPYIAQSECAALPREVRAFEPALALFGGTDGLQAYKRILKSVRDLLNPSGFVAMEIGPAQAEAIVDDLAAQTATWRCEVRADLAGRPRVVVAQSQDDRRMRAAPGLKKDVGMASVRG